MNYLAAPSLVFRLSWLGLRRYAWRFSLGALGFAVSLLAYTVCGTLLADLAQRSTDAWRLDWPCDAYVRVTADAANLAKAAQIAGVRLAEPGTIVNRVYLGATATQVLATAAASRIFQPEWAAGRAPAGADEIALPSRLAEYLDLGVGQEVVALTWDGKTQVPFRVSGLIADKVGLGLPPLVTREGAARLGNAAQDNVVFILLDGRISAEAAEKALKRAFPGTEVNVLTSQYEAVTQGVGITGAVVGLVRFCLLMAAAATLAALNLLSARTRAAELGMLRAIGLSELILWLTMVLDGLAAVAAGTGLAAGAMWALRSLLAGSHGHGLLGVSVDLTFQSADLIGAAVPFGIVALLAVGLTSRIISAQRVAAFLRGAE